MKVGGQILWNVTPICETSQTDLLSDGKTPYERRFGQPFKSPIIPFGSLVEYHPFNAKDQSRIHQFGKMLVFTVHSPRALHQSVPCSPQQQQQRAGALTLSSSCLDGSVTPVGPGLNPQYTGAPKAGGGCGLLAKSTTTSPMAQPQCSNVNMVAELFRSTAR